MGRLRWFGSYTVLLVAVAQVTASGCFGRKEATTETAAPSSTPSDAPANTSTSSSGSSNALTGTAWVPSVSGMSTSNHDSSVTVTKSVQTSAAKLVGLNESPVGREVTFTIDMSADLGPRGSLSLVAETINFPSTVGGSAAQGTAFPMLVSLSDGTNEYVNLSYAGGADCAGAGFWTYNATANSVSKNTSCVVNWPSAFFDRLHWEQHQKFPLAYKVGLSSNTFPTCNWTGGSAPVSTDPACAFNSVPFFVSGKLRSGVNYTAKYVLLASNYVGNLNADNGGNGYTAGIRLNVIKKTNPGAALGGAIDLNVFLVGQKNVQASRSVKGKQNLDTLFTMLHNHLNQTGTSIKLGKIQTVEWGSDLGGDAYAATTVKTMGNLMLAGGALVPSGTETKAINVYLVSTITDDSSGANSNLTVLGVSGGIGGPMIHGTSASGVLFSTFDKLGTYNPSCSSSSATCASNQLEWSFVDMSTALVHELGHYMGLNHLTEGDTTSHDVVRDTPICTAIDGSKGYITVATCLNTDTNTSATDGTALASGSGGKTCAQACGTYNTTSGIYCPAKLECQFNHVMFWMAKYFTESTGTGDGNKFSSGSAQILNYNPFVQ